MDRKTFIHTVAGKLACDTRRAEAITLVVFQELRNRITPKEATHVAAQMPLPLRELWLDGEEPRRQVSRVHRNEFLGRVRNHALLPDDTEALRAAQAVFCTLQHALGSLHGTEGEAWDILSQLPKDMKDLWIGAART